VTVEYTQAWSNVRSICCFLVPQPVFQHYATVEFARVRRLATRSMGRQSSCPGQDVLRDVSGSASRRLCRILGGSTIARQPTDRSLARHDCRHRMDASHFRQRQRRAHSMGMTVGLGGTSTYPYALSMTYGPDVPAPPSPPTVGSDSQPRMARQLGQCVDLNSEARRVSVLRTVGPVVRRRARWRTDRCGLTDGMGRREPKRRLLSWRPSPLKVGSQLLSVEQLVNTRAEFVVVVAARACGSWCGSSGPCGPRRLDTPDPDARPCGNSGAPPRVAPLLVHGRPSRRRGPAPARDSCGSR